LGFDANAVYLQGNCELTALTPGNLIAHFAGAPDFRYQFSRLFQRQASSDWKGALPQASTPPKRLIAAPPVLYSFARHVWT
jgi:hypothetical protein